VISPPSDVAGDLNGGLDRQELFHEQRAEAKSAVAGAECLAESIHWSFDLIPHDYDEASGIAGEQLGLKPRVRRDFKVEPAKLATGLRLCAGMVQLGTS
jgi:hypothetical protein